MDAEQNGSERMADITTMLSVVGQSLADLAVRLASATADEIPTLADDARISVQGITACCMDTGPLEHFTPDDAAALRAGLIQLAEFDVSTGCLARPRRKRRTIGNSTGLSAQLHQPAESPYLAACSNAVSAPMGSSPPASRPVLPSRLAVERATGGVTRPAPLMTNVFTSPGPKRHMVAVLGDVKAMDGSACADAASGNCSSWAGRHVAGERPSYCLLRGTALGHNCHS
jgi:hypothetical protein